MSQHYIDCETIRKELEAAQRMREAMECILEHSKNDKEGMSRTMHMIAINRYAKQALEDAS